MEEEKESKESPRRKIMEIIERKMIKEKKHWNERSDTKEKGNERKEKEGNV